MSSHAWIALASGIIVVLVLFGSYVVFADCNGVKQARNMRAARKHIDAIAPTLLALPGRDQIEMTEYTGGRCGAILVRGECATRQEADRLRTELAQTKPPVEVLFYITCPDSASIPYLIEPIQVVK